MIWHCEDEDGVGEQCRRPNGGWDGGLFCYSACWLQLSLVMKKIGKVKLPVFLHGFWAGWSVKERGVRSEKNWRTSPIVLSGDGLLMGCKERNWEREWEKIPWYCSWVVGAWCWVVKVLVDWMNGGGESRWWWPGRWDCSLGVILQWVFIERRWK